MRVYFLLVRASLGVEGLLLIGSGANACPACESHTQTLLGTTCIGLAKAIYGIFGREITKYTVYIRFWPTLHVYLL